MFYKFKKLFFIAIFLAVPEFSFAVSGCFIGMYVKFDAFKCDSLQCNASEKRFIPLGEYKDPLIKSFVEYNQNVDIVTKDQDLYINKNLTYEEHLNINSRDYYTIGDIRNLYPGYLIAEVNFYYFNHNKKAIEVNLIDPTDGMTIFFHRISSYSKNIKGSFFDAIAKNIAHASKDYICRDDEEDKKIYKKSDGYSLEK